MRQFIKRTATFSTLILALLIAAEVYVEQLPNPARDKHQWMLKHSREVETLILGSSHTFYGIRPDVLGHRAYSLAMVSQTYRYDAYLLQHYDMPRLKTVIVPFSYFSLWEDIDTQEDLEFEATRYRLYMDCPLHPRWGMYGFEFMHMDAFKEKLKSLYQTPHLSWDQYGWGTNYTLSSRLADWDNGKERARRNTYADHNDHVALNATYLEEIAAFCKKNGVKLILVTTPVSHKFFHNEDWYQRAVNTQVLKRLLKIHPEVHYLNIERTPDFVADDFYDADHLNGDGARKLSIIIRDFIEDKV